MLRKIYHQLAGTRTGLFILNKLFSFKYKDAAAYWEQRYVKQGNSGRGSFGDAAQYKASVLNNFIEKNNIDSVVEFGCGDGNQLRLYQIKEYTGYDVAMSSIETCQQIFAEDKHKSFLLYEPFNFDVASSCTAELSLSIDVIYHLVEEPVFQLYMQHLFACAGRYVIIYAWDVESVQQQHVMHRKFTRWIDAHQPGWRLMGHISSTPAGAYCDFFIYEKGSSQH